MSEIELRDELDRASAHLRPRADAQAVWALGTRARRRQRAMMVTGAAAATVVVVVAGATVQSIDSTAPDRPPATNPTPPDDSSDPAVTTHYVTGDQVQPRFDPADLASVPWDPDATVRSWDPVDPVSLAEDPVEHAAVAVRGAPGQRHAVSVLGDDGRWRSLDLSGLTPSKPAQLTMDSRSLSPDGTRIALGKTDGVVVVDLTSATSTSYDFPRLGERWQCCAVAWSADASTVYVGTWTPAPGRAVDLDTGDTHPVPFETTYSAMLEDGQVVEEYSSEIRLYDAAGRVVSRGPNVLDALEYPTARGDRWAAQRIFSEWSPADPRPANAPASGVLVMGPELRPEAFLPVKGYGLNGGDGSVLGWRGDDTVLFQVGLWSAAEDVVAWNVETGQLTRIATYANNRTVSVAADHLP